MKKSTVLIPVLALGLNACQSLQSPSTASSGGAAYDESNPYGSVNPYYGQQSTSTASQDHVNVTPVATASDSVPVVYNENMTPAPASAPAANTAPAASTMPAKHLVEKGETLYRISRMYSTTVENIKVANNLQSDLIRPGDMLSIP